MKLEPTVINPNISQKTCDQKSVESRTLERGGAVIFFTALYGEAPPERGTFFRLQVYERVGISLVGVYERKGKSAISVGCEKVKKTFWLCDLFIFKDNVFIAV